jgi:hypothetical protein
MAFKIVTADSKRTMFRKDVRLDTSRDTAILIRQSRRGSDVVHYESRLLQESLIPFVMEARCEDTLAHVRIFDEGAGVSGTKGIDKRKKLRSMMDEIVDNLIGDVVLARADRLFRDKHFANVSAFTTLAEKMKIKVVVPTPQGVIVYDLSKTKDLQNFQADMQASYAYVDNQIGYMNRARDYKMSRGFYGGGCIPLPYVLLREMPKEEQVQVIFEPWREASLDLFEKFMAFNFESGRIARYIEDKPYIFKFMEEEHLLEYLPVTNMRRVNGGYTFSSVKTILGYLSNLVLGGYAHGGRDKETGESILIAHAFDEVIPPDLLEPCYAAITGNYLDGTPFEKLRGTRQFRRDGIETDAILHGLLTSDDGSISVFAQLEDDYPIYACLKGGYNGSKTRAGLSRVLKAWTLPCREVDRILLDRLIALAEYDKELVERVKTYFAEANQNGASRLEVLDTSIAETQAALHKLSRTIVALTKKAAKLDAGNNKNAEATDLDPDDPIMVEHRRLRATLRNLEKQREEAAREAKEDPGKSIANFYYVLAHLRAEFNKKDPQTKQDIIRKLVDEVKVNAISPHLYSLQITWIEPITSVPEDVALLWRSDPTKDKILAAWSEEEEAALRTLYPDSQQLELLQAIPNKTAAQIKKRAWQLGVKRDYWHIEETERFYWTVSYKDLQIAAQYTDSAKERAFLWHEINTLAEHTRRGQLTASWFMPVDAVSFVYALSVTGENEGGQSKTSV